jgi:hypothetical protein
MKRITLTLLLLGLIAQVGAQTLQGHIVDAATGQPLPFASVGIVQTPMGTIADEAGKFTFQAKKQPATARVRFSMIGYEAQSHELADLTDTQNLIKLHQKPIALEEVTIHPTTEAEVGATRFHRSAGWSGWGGVLTRKGYEIGIKLPLGTKPVKIKHLHVRLHRQAFDTSTFRLHIRAIDDTLVQNELLQRNIYVTITREKGWAIIDLTPYQLVASGDVLVSLEWLKVAGLNADRAMKINKRETDAYILFKNNKNHTGYYRWGTEAKWQENRKNAPCMYLTILK